MDDKYIRGVLFWFYASALDWTIKCKKSVIICDKVTLKIYIGDSEDENSSFGMKMCMHL